MVVGMPSACRAMAWFCALWGWDLVGRVRGVKGEGRGVCGKGEGRGERKGEGEGEGGGKGKGSGEGIGDRG